MEAWAAARALGRDPNIRKRRAMAGALRHKAYVLQYDERVRPEFENLLAIRNRIPNRPEVSFPLRRAKGPRAHIIRDLAKEYGISARVIVRYINKFEFGT